MAEAENWLRLSNEKLRGEPEQKIGYRILASLRARSARFMVPLRMRSATSVRFHSYRDESHSRHFDLIGGGRHPWSIDLVT
jgi:hypothetical protein